MSVQLFVLDKVFRLMMKRRLRKDPDVLGIRPILDRMTRHARRIPADVTVETIELGGVRGERLATASADSSAAILYVHGGGMVAGSPRTHRALTWRLARGVGVAVHVPDYRLAPEHPFPAGLDDVVAAYRALVHGGIDARRIIVAGDSAGGNLTLAMALKLAAMGTATPAALVCLSPATDLLASSGSRRDNARSDAVFDERTFATLVRHYCRDVDPAHPFVSPLNGDVARMPPTLLQCSEIEMLRDDSVRMAEKMKAAGVDVTLERWPGVFHVWQLAADVLPEARRAIDRIVAFMKARLAVGNRSDGGPVEKT